jgi:hypothetical protein
LLLPALILHLNLSEPLVIMHLFVSQQDLVTLHSHVQENYAVICSYNIYSIYTQFHTFLVYFLPFTEVLAALEPRFNENRFVRKDLWSLEYNVKLTHSWS